MGEVTGTSDFKALTFLELWAAYINSSLPTFRDSLTTENKTEKLSRNVSKQLSIYATEGFCRRLRVV